MLNGDSRIGPRIAWMGRSCVSSSTIDRKHQRSVLDVALMHLWSLATTKLQVLVLLCEVEQDRAALEHGLATVLDEN
ncbi:hypothetical protein [Xanthomonas hortorum]|uniref:Uncharacterized protein n=1 Tax=Xanthomonas hortorum pv. hederae TaxID=453603 RepID=A0A9X3YZG1_9XANT|nr:hypothetical protein [Xanthomonas hortorum]MCE4369608.1 hypothetical protein [Xanthomonas hortorum pv. hederae]MDC8637106.1 hypothetical protein [Xanthomonas hortorum pv. hederae]PUF01218.1 hypothetical protein C7T87_03970 [Xanthomonas hortorum pv. hederae]